MSKMRTYLLAGTAATLLAVSGAVAADMSVKATPIQASYNLPSWTGPYFGVWGAYAANITNTDFSMAGQSIGDLGSSPRGPGVGAQLGYNWQLTNNVVFGLRADAQYLNVQGGGSIGGGVLAFSNATNWTADFDAIVLFPIGPLGLYFGGGVAAGGAKPNFSVIGTAAGIDTTSVGWNVLTGLQYKFDQHWSVFIEGDYFQLGDKSITIPAAGGIPAMTSNSKFHIIEQQAGIRYNF